jgi:hypothetical protein
MLTAILLFAAYPGSGNPAAAQTVSRTIPGTASLEFILVRAPGMDDEASNWEIAYEFRTANEQTLWAAQSQFKGRSQGRVGELVMAADTKRLVSSQPHNTINLVIPLAPQIQARLRKQPWDRVNLTAANSTPENIGRAKAQELDAQAFLLYCTVRIYDAKLKRNIVLPVARTWTLADYPDLKFEIKIELHDDGTYGVTSSTPMQTRRK